MTSPGVYGFPRKYELHEKSLSGARKNRSDLVDTFELLLDIGSLA